MRYGFREKWGIEQFGCIKVVITAVRQHSVKMIFTGEFSTVIFASSVLVAVQASGLGSIGSCPTAAIVDLTDESENLFPKNATWVENNRTLGCPCVSKLCVPLCCPFGYVISEKGCIEDSNTPDWLNLTPDDDIHFYVDDPCNMSTMKHNGFGHYFDDSNTQGGDSLSILDVRQLEKLPHCVSSKESSTSLLFAVCPLNTEINVLGVFCHYCLIVAIFFAIATFIVYSVVPELHKIQGLMFRCYLASYTACIFLLWMLGIVDKYYVEYFITFHLYLILYFGAASILWLNVMGFHIWRTFKNIRAGDDVNMRERETEKFRRYSIYVWSASAAIFVAFLVASLLKSKYISFSIFEWLPLPLGIIAICNLYFYISTASNIRELKKETAHLVSGLNKHCQVNEEWFTLYVKLFILMGGTAIMWIPFIYVHLRLELDYLMYFAFSAEALHSMLIFVLFVCKKDVRLSMKKRLNELLRGFSSYLRRGS